MTLKIKNMVCARCIMAVTELLTRLGIETDHIALGEAHIVGTLSDDQMERLKEELHSIGFELLEDPEAQTIARIKRAVVELVRADRPLTLTLSAALSAKLGGDFTAMSRTFAAHEGRTIEKYFLLQRMEYVKELLQYGERNLKEIAWQTGFSSVAHLSRQFKQLTGMTPTAYKECQDCQRTEIDQL